MEVLLQLHIKTVTHLGQMEPTSAEQGRFDTSMYQCKAPHGHEGENPHDRLRKNPKLKHAVSVFCCFFFFFAVLHGMWDLSSRTRESNPYPLHCKVDS